MAFYQVLVFVLLVGQVLCQFGFGEDVQSDPIAEECYGKVLDVYLILDSSTSIYVNDYRQELQFARDLVSRFDVGPRTTRVGLLTFSDDITRPPLDLDRYQTKSDLLASITEQNLPYRTGVTNTDVALRYVREYTGFRQGITKVVVVITDGGSRSPWITARESDLLREQGFYLFVIGVGQYQDEREWRNIANDPDDSFIYNVSNFRVLDQVKFTLPTRLCPLPPLDIARRCDITRNSDVFFVAGPGGTYEGIQIIEKVVDATRDTAGYLRLSYLLGICSNAESVPLSNVNNYCDRQQAINPATPDSYVQLLSRLRTIARQGRRGTKQVAVLFLDEDSLRLNRQGLLNEARNIGQTDNIEIIVVDLGTRGYGNILQNIASYRDNIITFVPGSLGPQRIALNALIDRLCRVINGEGSVSFPPAVITK